MTTLSIATIDLDAHRTNTRFSRMRGRAAQLREKMGILSADEVFSRWAAGAPDVEIDAMRSSLQVSKLRSQLTPTAG